MGLDLSGDLIRDFFRFGVFKTIIIINTGKLQFKQLQKLNPENKLRLGRGLII